MAEVMKLDAGKPRTDLLPPDVLMALGNVLSVGAMKYAARRWEGGMSWGRVYGAASRHLFAFWAGEDLDEETGLPHIDLALCETMFLAAYFRRKVGTDDRFKLKLGQDYSEKAPAKCPSFKARVYRAFASVVILARLSLGKVKKPSNSAR